MRRASDLVASRGSGAARGPGLSHGSDTRASYPVGRPTRIEQNTDADAAAEVTARIAYDHEGRVIHRRVTIDTLPAKDVFYRYDLAGKVTAMVYPDGTETRYAYDAAGRLAGVTDAGGNALAAYAHYTYLAGTASSFDSSCYRCSLAADKWLYFAIQKL